MEKKFADLNFQEIPIKSTLTSIFTRVGIINKKNIFRAFKANGAPSVVNTYHEIWNSLKWQKLLKMEFNLEFRST